MFPEGLQTLYQDHNFKQGWRALKKAFKAYNIPYDGSLEFELNSAVTLADLARIEHRGNERFAFEDITSNDAWSPILSALGIPEESLRDLSDEDLGDLQRSVRSALHIMQDGFRVRS